MSIMKKQNKDFKLYIMKIIYHRLVALSLVFVIVLFGCKDELVEEPFIKDEASSLITQYLDTAKNYNHMSALLEKSGMDILLNTYGSYTVFAPSDEAFTNYLTSIGKNSIDELDTNQISALVDFHVILNYIDVKAYETGLLGYSDTTVSGIRHFIDLTQGLDHIIINKTSLIEGAFEVSNGIIYAVDVVLEPHANNIFDYINESGRYNIMAEAFEDAGLKDTLQNLELLYPYFEFPFYFTPLYTVFLESDEVLKSNGINSLSDLKSKVWENKSGNPADANEALFDFLNYHIISGRRTTGSMYKDENITTLGIDNSTIIHVDEAIDYRKPEPILNSNNTSGGISLNDMRSDISFANGLVHELNDMLYINTNYTQSTIIRECEDGIVTAISSAGYVSNKYLTTFAGGLGYVRFRSNIQFSALGDNSTGLALVFYPVEEGDWVEFVILNVVPGKYNVYLNYQREKTEASKNINVYFRNYKDDFDWRTQLFLSGLDLADQDNVVDDLEYNQNRRLGSIEIKEGEYGNYVFRFAHVDIYSGVYDNLILEPIQ